MELGGQGSFAALKKTAGGEGIDRRFIIAGRCAAYMAMGFVLSCARLMGGGAPLGMALTAAAAPSLAGILPLQAHR